MKIGQKITWIKSLGKGSLTTGTIKYILQLEEPLTLKTIEMANAITVNEIDINKEFVIIAEEKDELYWVLKHQIRNIIGCFLFMWFMTGK